MWYLSLLDVAQFSIKYSFVGYFFPFERAAIYAVRCVCAAFKGTFMCHVSVSWCEMFHILKHKDVMMPTFVLAFINTLFSSENYNAINASARVQNPFWCWPLRLYRMGRTYSMKMLINTSIPIVSLRCIYLSIYDTQEDRFSFTISQKRKFIRGVIRGGSIENVAASLWCFLSILKSILAANENWCSSWIAITPLDDTTERERDNNVGHEK